MTDNEIIKALECCSKNPNDSVCYESKCPLFGQKCIDVLPKNALSLINRQKTEIKSLQERDVILRGTVDCQKAKIDELESNDYKLKAEAIKEFAERLKDMHKHNTTSVVSLVTVFDNINSLVKEMVGADNG